MSVCVHWEKERVKERRKSASSDGDRWYWSSTWKNGGPKQEEGEETETRDREKRIDVCIGGRRESFSHPYSFTRLMFTGAAQQSLVCPQSCFRSFTRLFSPHVLYVLQDPDSGSRSLVSSVLVHSFPADVSSDSGWHHDSPFSIALFSKRTDKTGEMQHSVNWLLVQKGLNRQRFKAKGKRDTLDIWCKLVKGRIRRVCDVKR